MIVFEVFLNNKPVARAGSPDSAVLAAIVDAAGKLGPESRGARGKREGVELTLSVGGLTAREANKDEYLTWVRNPNLKVGDEITVRIVEAGTADDALERKSASEVYEDMECRKFYWAKKTYFELKDKYEKNI
jgi:hypothetical protein